MIIDNSYYFSTGAAVQIEDCQIRCNALLRTVAPNDSAQIFKRNKITEQTELQYMLLFTGIKTF